MAEGGVAKQGWIMGGGGYERPGGQAQIMPQHDTVQVTHTGLGQARILTDADTAQSLRFTTLNMIREYFPRPTMNLCEGNGIRC